MFAGLGWEKEITSLGDLHILFNSSPEFEFRPENAGSDDYLLTPFLQYEKKEHRHEDVSEQDVDLEEDNLKETK